MIPMRPGQNPPGRHFTEYARLLDELQSFIRAGRGDTDQAEEVREAMDGLWNLLSPEEARAVRDLAAGRKGLPVDVKLPNATTRRALKEADDGKNLVRYESFDDFAKTMTDE
jgi:hypothetical protein